MDNDPDGSIALQDLARLVIHSGDVVVLRSSRRLSQAGADRLHRRLAEAFPDHQVLVLDEGHELATAGGPE
jgi:hypothetical protein